MQAGLCLSSLLSINCNGFKFRVIGAERRHCNSCCWGRAEQRGMDLHCTVAVIEDVRWAVYDDGGGGELGHVTDDDGDLSVALQYQHFTQIKINSRLWLTPILSQYVTRHSSILIIYIFLSAQLALGGNIITAEELRLTEDNLIMFLLLQTNKIDIRLRLLPRQWEMRQEMKETQFCEKYKSSNLGPQWRVQGYFWSDNFKPIM